jgi:predicted dehydrogenase
MKPLRTAILGCGGFANKHAQNLLLLPESIDLVAFCDRNEERAQAYAEKYNTSAAVYTNHRDLFDKARLDLVVIAIPPYGHSDEVELSAQYGIHVFIEKPIALTTEHAWRMVAAAEAAGIKTQVGFMFRFGAAVRRMKGLIDAGEAGQAGLMSARYFCNSLHAEWWRSRGLSGGQLVEQVIHMVDLMRFLMGEAATVYSLQNNLYHQDVPGYTVEDVSGTVIGFKSGGIGVIYASNNAVPMKWTNDYRLVTRAITAEFDDANHARLTYTTTPDLEVETIVSEEDYYLLELKDLLRAIETGGNTLTPLREGALTLELALAAARSAETKSIVCL